MPDQVRHDEFGTFYEAINFTCIIESKNSSSVPRNPVFFGAPVKQERALCWNFLSHNILENGFRIWGLFFLGDHEIAIKVKSTKLAGSIHLKGLRKFKFLPLFNKSLIFPGERGITFEEIVQRIESGANVIETDHPNKRKYPNQKKRWIMQHRRGEWGHPKLYTTQFCQNSLHFKTLLFNLHWRFVFTHNY